MSSRQDALAVVKDACNISDERAAFFLDAADGSAEGAIMAYFDAASQEQDTAPAPVPVAAGASQRPRPAAPTASSASRAPKRERVGGIATMSSIRDGGAPAPSGPPSTNESYAGGHSSGIAVSGGPDRAGQPRGGVYDAVKERAVGGDEVEEGLQKVTLTEWQGGVFSLDDGVNPVVPKNPATDPEFAKFLEAVMQGRLPPGFTSDTHLVYEDKREEAFKPPPMKPFSGAGRRLGDVVPPVAGAGGAHGGTGASAAAAPTVQPPAVVVDEGLPTTRVQIRLADGTRLVGRFNPTQTVADLRHFVTHAQPASFIDREFVLMTTFPNRVIENEDLSIEDAKLCNAAVVQKWK